ncbi:MAG: family 20 glycosylhydrolase [Planctomycetota bacterium]|nr:family 20 glycosylhydrolase [Planctomycetota bacterium]
MTIGQRNRAAGVLWCVLAAALWASGPARAGEGDETADSGEAATQPADSAETGEAATKPAESGGSNLLPTPKSIALAGGEMKLTPESRIVAGEASLEPLAHIVSGEIRLVTNLRLAVVKGEARPGDIVLKIDPKLRADADIVAVQKKDGKQQVVRTRDFAHTIVVADTAVVTGWDYRAVCEGTATILQALAVKEGKVSLAKMTVKDWPYADYTGTMIDAARQWIPPDAVKFTIEACRFWKIRYVQMHFSDDHAYTFGSKAFPTLGKKNWPISDGIIARCYTWEEMRDLEAYAVARGVTIVPELETPGHSGAMARCRPDYFSGPGCMPMASEKLYEGLDKIMGEMCSIFRATPYFHIGCDEANTGGVGNTPAEKEYMKKHTLPGDDHPLNDAWQIYIMHVIRMKQLCQKYGKMPIAWEGMPADKRIKDDIVIMTWYSAKCASEVEQQGWTVITVPWFTGPIQTWNIFYANDHIYQRTTNVLGAQRPMWQMSEYSLHESYVPSLCERQERTWGPDNEWGAEAGYRARMARSTERMFQVAAPIRVKPEGAKILGVSDGLKGWIAYSGAMRLRLTAANPAGCRIHYTLDGSDPSPRSPVYTGPMAMQQNFRLNAALFQEGRMLGSVTRVKYEWRGRVDHRIPDRRPVHEGQSAGQQTLRHSLRARDDRPGGLEALEGAGHNAVDLRADAQGRQPLRVHAGAGLVGRRPQRHAPGRQRRRREGVVQRQGRPPGQQGPELQRRPRQGSRGPEAGVEYPPAQGHPGQGRMGRPDAHRRARRQ